MTATRIETRYDKRFGMYLAVAPDLHYCTGLGKTPEEARARLELAISLWFDADGGLRCPPGSGDSREGRPREP